MSDEIEFEGGFFDEAGIDANDVADDPYGFGNDFWPLRIIETGAPKLTAKGDKIGMSIKWAVEHPKYDGHAVAKQLGNGNWVRLPVPQALRSQVPFDPKNDPQDAQVLTDLKELYKALGIPADQMGKQNHKTIVGKMVLSKIRPRKNEEGFWNFNLFAMKPYDPEAASNNDGASASAPANNGGESAEERLARELAGE